MHIEDFNPNTGSEQASIAVVFFLLIAKINEASMLQEISYTAAILLACLTMFINRKVYLEQFKLTDLYRFIKNALTKNNRRSS